MSPNHDSALTELVHKLGVHMPTDEQAAVMRHPLTVAVDGEEVTAPLLVVAGAGSGKTETMSMRAVYLAAQMGVEDDAILGLTFTRKAAAELESRLTQRLAQLRAGHGAGLGLLEFESAPQASTYDSFALDVVREFGPALGLSTDFVHLDSASAWQLMLDVIEGWEGDLDTDLTASTLADRALELRQQIANQALTVSQVRRRLTRLTRKFEENLAARKRGGALFQKGLEANQLRLRLLDVIDVFEFEKEKLGRLDFVDQTMLATRIVENVPAAKHTLRERHQVVFLDEFQDTSVAQMRFLSALFADHPVTAVGDPNQAIYGWRGASAASLQDFHDLFSTNPKSPRTTLTLSVAWRNSETILEVANAVAVPLRQGAGDVATPILTTRDGAPRGAVRARYASSLAEEDATVVEFLQENFAEAAAAGLPRPTAAVLSRTRVRMLQILEACRAAGVPAEIGGEDGLLLHPAVADLRAALEVAQDIGKSTQLLRLLGNLDLGSADLYALGKLARKLSPEPVLLEAVEHLLEGASQGEPEIALSVQARSRVRRLGRQLQRIRAAADWTILEQVEFARKVLGLDEQAAVLTEAADVTEVLDTFAQAAADYQESAVNATMSGFLEWLSVAETKERGLPLPRVRSNPDAVQIMTVHGAKGLEWDLVAVVGLGSGKFPSVGTGSGGAKDGEGGATVKPPSMPPKDNGWWTVAQALPYSVRDDRAHLPAPDIWDPEMALGKAEIAMREEFGQYKFDEERRLAYVAFTRPKSELLLTGAWVDTAKAPRYPSPFYVESTQALGLEKTWDPCPNESERELLLQGQDQAVFPPPPGVSRKQIALSAARVESELAFLSEAGAGEQPTLEEVLASLPDQALAQSVSALLEQRDRDSERASWSVEERSKDQVAANRQMLAFFTATELAGLDHSDEVFTSLRRPIPAEPTRSAAIGTAFHAWVEDELRRASAVGSENEPALSDAVSQLAPSAALLTPAQANQLREMQDQFRQIDWVEGKSVEGLEVPFDVEVGGLLVRGRVDAVFRDPESGSTLLVDWKTGAPPRRTGNIERDTAAIRRLLVQLELYVHAWKGRVGTAPEASLVFVGADSWQVTTLDQLREEYQHLVGEPLSVEGLAAAWGELLGVSSH